MTQLQYNIMLECYQATVVRMRRFFLVTAILLSMNSVAKADLICSGNVKFVGVGKYGVLMAEGPGGLPLVYLCNVVTENNGVKPEACKSMHATLLAAKMAAKPVSITFNPNPNISCGDFNSWSWASNLNWIYNR